MKTPDNFTFRPINPDSATEIQSLLRLFLEIEAVDQEGDEITEEILRLILARKGRQRWIAHQAGEPGSLAGYASVHMQTPERAFFTAAVHPAWRRRGLGSQFLEDALAFARENNAQQISSSANATNQGANAFLLVSGFRVAGSAWALHAPAETAAGEAALPDGYTILPYTEVNNPRILAEVCNLSRRDMWGHAENTPGAVTEQDMPSLLTYWLPENIFLAFDPQGQAVGICAVQPAEQPNNRSRAQLIDAPTIVPAQRQRGLHLPLLLAAMHRLRSCAAGEIRLEAFGDSEEAVGLYQQAGFILDSRYIAYCCDLQ
ncbi:MAG: GNAT family N-acetyltransferase [Chloroflexota bacterium]